MKTKNHAVWDVYDKYRTIRLNVLYYEKMTDKLRRNNIIIESLLIAFASSNFAGLWFWNSLIGGYVWKVFAAIVALLAVLKPVLKTSDRLRVQCEILISYHLMDHDFQKLVLMISQNGKYDESLKDHFFTLLDRLREIIIKDPQTNKNNKMIERCYGEVLEQLPAANFFEPEE